MGEGGRFSLLPFRDVESKHLPPSSRGEWPACHHWLVSWQGTVHPCCCSCAPVVKNVTLLHQGENKHQGALKTWCVGWAVGAHHGVFPGTWFCARLKHTKSSLAPWPEVPSGGNCSKNGEHAWRSHPDEVTLWCKARLKIVPGPPV